MSNTEPSRSSLAALHPGGESGSDQVFFPYGSKDCRIGAASRSPKLCFGDLQFRRIPEADLRFFSSALFDPDSPAGPVAAHYLFVPLTVYPSDGAFVVVDGCKRLRQARREGLAQCNCMVITPSPDEHTAALLRIILNSNRSLDFVEKYLFVKWLKEHCDDGVYREVGRLLPVDDRERFELERLAGSDGEVAAAVRDGVLDIANAVQAGYLEPPERAPVFSLLRRYPFSRQMQRELLDWLPELAFREKCTVADIVAAPWVREIENNKQFNGPQKIDHLRATLFNRRFPTLAQTKKQWDYLAAKLNPDHSLVQFKPSEAFEKNRLEIKITATSGEQARELFCRLAEIPAEKWNQLIYPVMTRSVDVE